MRKIIRTAVLAAATVTALAVPASALASTSPINSSTIHGNGSSSGKGSVSEKFTYTDPIVGPVVCNEVHHQTNVLPTDMGIPAGAVTQGGWDSVTCASTTGSPLVNVAPNEVVQYGWISDFANAGQPFNVNSKVSYGTIIYTVSPDGMSYTGAAWYPAG